MTGPLTFLVASPHLRGSFFEESVVLLLEHDEKGAMGLLVHLPTQRTLGEMLPDELPGSTEPLWVGGPVETSLGWCLYGSAVGEGKELQLVGGLMVSSHLETLRAVVRSGQRFMLLLGYSGWDAGQLTAEAREGTWLWVEQDTPELIWDVAPEDRWAEALRRLGVAPQTIMPGGAQA